MMIFLLTLLFLGLLYWLFSLQGQVDKLEQQLVGKSAPVKVAAATTSKPKTVSKKVARPAKKPTKKLNLEEWLTKKLFPILGSVSLILAVTYFATMAINNGWIGPMGQLSLAALACVVLLGLGEWLRPKYPDLFAYLSAAGVAGLMMTTFVAQTVYGLIGPVQSFMFYSAIVATGVFLSLRYSRRELANLALVGGLLAPVLTQAPEPSALGLMLFLLSLAVAGFAVSMYKKWPELLALLLVGTFFYEIALVHSGGTAELPLFYLGLIYVIHGLLGSGGVIRALRDKKQSELSTSLGPVTLIVSVLTANWLGYEIFAEQGWGHFGFFVLLQSLVWFGLSHWSGTQKMPTYQRLFLLGGLASVLFATLWELKAAHEMIVTGVLAVESIALAWIARLQKSDLMSLFGGITAFFVWVSAYSVMGIWWSLLAIILAGAALLLVAHTFQIKSWRNVLKVIAFALVTNLILWWQSDFFSDWVADWLVLDWVLMGTWLLAVMWWSKKPGETIYKWPVVVVAAFMAFVGLFEYDSARSIWDNGLMVDFFLGLLAILAWMSGTSLQRRVLLVLAVLHLLVFGGQILDEPIRTVFWLGTGILALFVGLQKDWAYLRYAGLGLITWVIAKLYILDVWQWEIWIRFSAFLALGIALLGVTFYYQRLNNKK